MSTTASPHGIDGATFDYSQLAKQNAGIQFMERATGHPVRVLLKQAGLLSRSTEDVHLLDNACGGGVVSSYLFERVDGEARKGLKVTCGDLEPKMLETTRERMAAEGWTAETAVVDAQAIPFPDDTFTHVATSFAYQLFPDGQKALREAHRVLKPGGKASLTAWTSVGWLAPIQAAVPTFATPVIFSGDWSVDSKLRESYAEAGFTDVKVEATEHGTWVEDAETLLATMRGFLGKLLEGEGGERFLKVLKEKYGEGEFVLEGWRALVVTGTKAK